MDQLHKLQDLPLGKARLLRSPAQSIVFYKCLEFPELFRVRFYVFLINIIFLDQKIGNGIIQVQIALVLQAVPVRCV